MTGGGVFLNGGGGGSSELQEVVDLQERRGSPKNPRGEFSGGIKKGTEEARRRGCRREKTSETLGVSLENKKVETLSKKTNSSQFFIIV